MSRLQVELGDRWSAVALMNELGRYHSFLVEPDTQHWLVHASSGEEELTALIDKVEAWRHERHLDDLSLRLYD